MRAALLTGVLAAIGLPGAASAQAIVSTGESFISVRLLPGEGQADGTRLAGLRLSVEPGWKTYWRSPGETGIPPQLDWSGSENVRAVEVLWPRPEVFQSFGMRTVGYSGDMVLPLRLTPAVAGQPMTLVLDGVFGVCRDICVLEEVSLSEHIGPDQGPIGYKQVRRALAKVPMPATEAGLSHASCTIAGAGRDREMRAELVFDADPGQTDVVVEGAERLWVKDTHVSRDGETVHVTAHLRLPSEGGWIDRGAVRMTVLAETFSVDLQGCRAG